MNANQSRPSGRRLRETLPRERIASLMAIPNFDASASKFGAASDFRVQPCSIAPASWSAPVLWRFGILCGESQRSVSRALGKPGSFRGVLPHPGPLPLGEGEPAPSACSRRTHRWHRIRRLTLPPLPAGEGRGEGERHRLSKKLVRSQRGDLQDASAGCWVGVNRTPHASQSARGLAHSKTWRRSLEPIPIRVHPRDPRAQPLFSPKPERPL